MEELTGPELVVALPIEVQDGDVRSVANAVRADKVRERFPGLAFGDLPCLWIEDDAGQHEIVRLPTTLPQVIQLFRVLSDICRETKDVRRIKSEASRRLGENIRDRSAFVAIITGDLMLDKRTVRFIALVCGVLFVALILALAIFIPRPTDFQYTVFRIVLALAAAGFVSMTPGFIEVKITNWLRAGGALAVFAIVYFYAPAALQAVRH